MNTVLFVNAIIGFSENLFLVLFVGAQVFEITDLLGRYCISGPSVPQKVGSDIISNSCGWRVTNYPQAIFHL